MDLRTDAQLALAAADGDRDALAAIYDKYADTLYELCRAVLRDSHEASDALQDTFVIAATRLSGLREPDRLKPWLCAIARHESIRRSSKRARSRPSAHEEVLDVPVIDNSADNLMADDAANLVWEAAEALTDRERSLLMLNVRQGLEGADLAEAAGLDGPTTSVVLSRAKTQLAAAVRCTLLIRNGRKECAELSAIVPKAHHALDGLTRKRVTRHAASCEICEPKWNASPDALGVLAAAPLLGAPALKDKILKDPRLISNSRPLGGRGWTHDGWPPPEERARRPLFVSLAAAAIALVVAAALLLNGDNDSPKLRGVDTVDSNTTIALGPTTTAAPLDPTTVTSVPRRTTTTAKKKPTGATTPTTRPATVGTPAPTTTPPPPPTTTTTTSRVTINGSAPRSATTCDSFTITATVSGQMPSGALVFASVKDAGGGTSGVGMKQTGANTWASTFNSTAFTPGSAIWTVAVTGPGGDSDSGSFTITPCPR